MPNLEHYIELRYNSLVHVLLVIYGVGGLVFDEGVPKGMGEGVGE